MGTLIFDLDGTLSDPAVGIGQSLNYTLEALGYRCITADEGFKFVGPPLDWAFRQIVPDASDETVRALVAKYRERYGDVGYAENVLYAGIAEALAQLSAAGVRMGVCTSKRTDFAERILDMFGLRGHFRFVSGGDVGVTKHDQLRSLLEQHAVTRTSIMIGDRAVDVHAARANKLGAVGVRWGYGAEAELLAADPDRILGSPAELLMLGQQLWVASGSALAALPRPGDARAEQEQRQRQDGEQNRHRQRPEYHSVRILQVGSAAPTVPRP